jgi:hypothetical protein
MNVLPAWVMWLQSLATPGIAVAGLLIAYSNHNLAVQRRKDSLFDRRYELLLRVFRYLDQMSEDRINDEWAIEEHGHIKLQAHLLFGKKFADQLEESMSSRGPRLGPGEISIGDLFERAMR